jgi:hypothetical protein
MEAGKIKFIVFGLNFFSFLTAIGQHCIESNSSNTEIISSHYFNTDQSKNLIEFKIPVIFHVIGDALQLSDSIITLHVNALNRIYSSSDTLSTNSTLTKATPIRFVLTLNSNTSQGIYRYQSAVESFNTGQSLFTDDYPKYSQYGGANAINTNKSLNIWICNLDPKPPSSDLLLGYAFPPTLSSDWDFTSFVNQERQGVVINYKCFLNPEYAGILAHEIGHYLGLRHIWGNSSNSCDNDDGIEDTPLSATPSYNCDFAKNTCDQGTGDLPDMIDNVMDYSPASCGKYFTYGQVQRMISNLVYLRPDLYTSEPGDDSVTIMEAFPNPSFGKFTVFLHTTRTIPKSTLEIIDLTGKIVYSEEFNGKKQLIEIPPEHFRHGLYILRLHNKKYCLTKKVQFVDR